jgi:hypothetical protein
MATQVVLPSKLTYNRVEELDPSVLKYKEPNGAESVGAPDPKHTPGDVDKGLPIVKDTFPPAVTS